MMDWYGPVRAKSGAVVSGAAALNVRIAALGGMEAIILNVAIEAARGALDRANAAARQSWPKLRRLA